MMSQDQNNISGLLEKISHPDTPKKEQQDLLLSAAEFIVSSPEEAKPVILEQLLMAFGLPQENQSTQKISFEMCNKESPFI